MIQNTEDHASLGGNAKVQGFNIELNAVMFDMLVSKVYTDKVMAVIREWSTNAIDACIDAKKPIKFNVHLPTVLEPHYSVRDYGTGLSDEDVLGLYSTLGASTKRDSNEFNGTFGIGRGAGLAYSDSFQVDSYFHGMKISYLVSTDSGMPAMISLGQTATKEPNGLEIRINVLSKDIGEFEKKAKDVYQYFEHKPNTNTRIDYPKTKKLIEGDNWYIEDSNYGSRYNSVPLAIMGNVAYIIDRSHFTSSKDIYAMLSSSIRFDVPLGAIGITPGRESLSMDEATVDYLTKRFIAAKEEAVSALVKTLKGFKTPWEQMTAFNVAVSSLPHAISSDVKWRPKGIKHISSANYYRSSKLAITDSELPNNVAMMCYQNGYTSGRSLSNSHSFDVSDKIKFMIADERTGFANAAMAYRDSLASGKSVILIKMSVYTKDEFDDFFKKAKVVCKELGEVSYVLSSAYSVMTPTTTTKGSSMAMTARNFAPLIINRTSTDNVYLYKGGMLNSYAAKKFYYFEASGHNVINIEEKELSAYYRFFQLHRAQTTGNDYKIVGVPKGAMTQVKLDPRFIPIKEAAKSHEKEVSFIDYEPAEFLNTVSNSNSNGLLELVKGVDNKDTKQFVSSIVAFDKKHPYYNRRTSTIGINDYLTVKTTAPDINISTKEFKERYPLLETLHRSYSRPKSVAIARYMNIEDIARTCKKE